MTTLNVRLIECDLRAILERHGPASAGLEIADSVQDWARGHGLKEDNPFRQATAFPSHGLIVMCAGLTEDQARSSSSVLTLGPIAHEALAQDLRYLLLHEIAHLRGILDEPGADEWALARLNEDLMAAGENPIPT